MTAASAKTSTKDAIYCVLKNKGVFARKSQKSMNSDIGLPLTVIGAPNAWHSISGWLHNMAQGAKLILRRVEYPDCLILELGADHPGDISKIAAWLRPDIAVITRVSRTPVHVEFFDSPEQVFEEKLPWRPQSSFGGTLILFADDEKVMSIADRVKGRNVSVISFGTSSIAAVRGSGETVVYENQVPIGISFKLDLDGNSIPITLRGVIGQTYLYPDPRGCCGRKGPGMSPSSIIQAIGEYEAPRAA